MDKPTQPYMEIPETPLSVEYKGAKEALKINLSQAVNDDLNLYVSHSGETKSEVISNGIKSYLNSIPSWIYRRYFIENKDKNFVLPELNHITQKNYIYVVCTSHPSSDYREYICAQIVNSSGNGLDDPITIKPLYYLPQIYGEEINVKSGVILPQFFSSSPQTPVLCTQLKYEIPKKFVWAILKNH